MFLVMLLKPLVGLVLFGVVLCLARAIIALIPEGRVKRLLTRPIGVRDVTRRWH